ncbi:COQ9-domain-containing protein [Spinellus fusiger]|nr:COQ9-domain-containing protein [Spinellus fusiger]
MSVLRVLSSRLFCPTLATKRLLSTSTSEGKDVQNTLLKATLPHVKEHGWSLQSMQLGAASLNYPSVAHGVFPKGGASLVDAFLKECRQQFIVSAEERKNTGQLEGYTVNEKVKMLTMMRLALLKPYAQQWPEALSIMALPSNVGMSLGHLAELVDDIYFYAGDKSPDMGWYTKRASLAAIYSATELFMTQDMTPNHAETFRFLNRRLDDVAWVDASTRQLGAMVAFSGKSLLSLLAMRTSQRH